MKQFEVCEEIATYFNHFKTDIISYTQTCDVDLNNEVAQIPQAAPFVTITGKPGEENAQYYVCAENGVLVESKSIRAVIIDLLATYYVFDLSYPKTISAFLLFFQHIIFELKDSQAFPATAAKLVANLNKVLV